ncbi:MULTISPECIES: HypC/HybG/HupF family hydrogenase formation chaperone [unclassified Hyphomicrobium]|uniref:HypC/HybG/HupF family hydrogenase formation chaperone n=1 Tax=unclassified Hyphomicrobium TaxID=2619925 RepID=UPI000213F74F|nr:MULTISPECIES: HypC/HybG/HupF family hydrogenase formation chaperone [unclassified Hyphomicrobium]CCB63676.1 Hydrogenase expression/formation protein hypC [Hyphomicrobium sp. MC1]
MCLGIPGRIVKIDDADKRLATVDVSGVKRQVNVACIIDDDNPIETCVGEWVLVHVGFAMSRIDEAEAAETLRILHELGEAQAEMEAMRASGLQ